MSPIPSRVGRVLLFCLTATAGSAYAQSEVGEIYSATVSSSGRPAWTRKTIPASAVGRDTILRKVALPSPKPPRDVIEPALRARMEHAPQERAEVIITFRDDETMPVFPRLDRTQPDDAPVNARALAQRARLIDELETKRKPKYDRRASELTALGAATRATFWLIDGMVVELPLSAIAAIAAREDVQRIERTQTSIPPPTVGAGRALINSDYLYNGALNNGTNIRFALLDTGSPPNPPNHIDFAPRTNIDLERDCVRTPAVNHNNCSVQLAGYQPQDTVWNHGTASNGILMAAAGGGNQYRGVTPFKVGNFNVYNNAGLVRDAAVRAFGAAVALGYEVIVAEMQDDSNDLGAVAVAADNAFNSGVAVIAANGNYGPNASTVASPAVAHRVIGVGAFDYQTGATLGDQSRGPASDGRTKPDIQAPSRTSTSSNSSYLARQFFGGTSGATPYAAGAAGLFGYLMDPGTYALEPGHIYAALIDAGRQAAFDNTAGAGKIVMPGAGAQFWFGSVTVSNQSYVDVALPQEVNLGSSLYVALWWADPSTSTHSDIDLSVFDYSVRLRGSSWSVDSVFEKASTTAVLSQGNWSIRILGYSVPTGTQKVYWSAHLVP